MQRYLTKHATQNSNINYSVLTVSGGIQQSSDTLSKDSVYNQQGKQELESESSNKADHMTSYLF